MTDNKKNNGLGLELTIMAAGMSIRIGLMNGAVNIEPAPASGHAGGCSRC